MPTRSLPLLVLVAAIAAGATSRSEEAGVILAVEGRSNQTPWAASLGSFVAVTWGATAEGKADVYLAVSRDGGGSFTEPVRVNATAGEARLGGELPPRVALVPRQASADPEIVLAFGSKAGGTEIRVTRSHDGGRTFTSARELQAPGAAGDRGWHAMALDPSGSAHVMWLDHRGLAGARAESREQHEASAMDGATMARRSGLYYARDGESPFAEREVLKGVCYCCKVAMASGSDGTLFAAWRHVYPGNIRDIAFTVSRDGGASFGDAGRVSTDDWHLAGCPDDGPAMAVDGRGTAHIVWPTVIGGAAPEGAIFYASSADGKAFTPRVRVPTLGSPRPMHPQILVEADGRLTIAWDEVVNGARQAAVRTMAVDEAGRPTFGATRRLGTAGTPSSYPILIATPRGRLAVHVEGSPGATVIRTSVL